MLRAQPATADLPVERWQDLVWAAFDWGLLSPHEQIRGYVTLQPILPYFLRGRLALDAARKEAVEAAFRRLYDQWGGQLGLTTQSNKAQERQTGLALIGIEYENLRTAVELALAVRQSFFNPYGALSEFLKSQQAFRPLLDLSEAVWRMRDKYDSAAISGKIGLQFGRAVEDSAWCLAKLRRLEESRRCIKGRIEWLEEIGGEYESSVLRWRGATFHQLGIVEQEQRQLVQAEVNYRQALSIFDEFNDLRGKAGAHYQLGTVAQDRQQWAQAEEHYERALSLSVEIGDSLLAGNVHELLGIVAHEQGEWSRAENHCEQALAIFAEFGDLHAQGKIHHLLGTVALAQEQWAQAEQHYRQALAIFVKFGDRYEQAKAYAQLANMALEKRQWAQAEQHYRQALGIFVEFDDRYSQAKSYYDLGMVAQEQGQWAEAEGHYRQALAVLVEFGDEHNRDMTIRNMMRLWQESGLDSVPGTVAEVLGISRAEAEELMRKALGEGE